MKFFLALALLALPRSAAAEDETKNPACPPAVGVHRAGLRGLINPLLDVEPSLEFSELRPFKFKVEQLIAVHHSSGGLNHASVYFRDLNNGPAFGIEATSKFSPASLLKLPVMMAVFKEVEEDPSFARRHVQYQPFKDVTPSISTATLKAGEFYSLGDLTRAMIVDSDNGATFLLRSVLPPGHLDKVFGDLGVSIPDVRTPEDYMSVQEYATFFRILYNASYLTHADSETALEFLATTRFKEGLVAGVPEGTVVAHKFGERSVPHSRVRQLHDCGIVYYPPRPYILCIMTQDEDFAVQTRLIREVSRLVYQEVSGGSPVPAPTR